MPRHKRRHRKDLKYWVKKLFPFVFQRRRPSFQPFEKAPAEAKFLTLEDIKAARAEAFERDQEATEPVSPPVFEDTQRPQLNFKPGQNRKKKSATSRLKRVLKKISFNSFKKKYKSSSAEKYHFLTPEDIKRAKEANDTDTSTWHPEVEIDISVERPELDIRTSTSRKRKHLRKKRRGFFSFFNKKKKRREPSILSSLEFTIPEQERIPVASYIRPVLNSTALFIVAYLVSWFIYQFAVMVTASFSKIDSVLYYYEVMFPIGNYSPKWNQTNIIFITLSGPMISLIMAIFYRFVVLRKFHPGAQMRQFFVWLYLNSMMLFFGAFVGGAITRQGFGYVVDWLYMNIAFRILFSLIFLMLIGWISWKVVSYLPETVGKESYKNNRNGYIISRLIIPWFIGGGLMVLMKLSPVIPQHENIFNYDAFTLATLMFAVVPPLFNTKVKPHLLQNRKSYPRTHRTTIAAWIIIAIALVLLVRVGLSYGMYFMFNISLDIGRYH
ncbi:MAG: hypothetical protein IPH88_02465 [Bacteroidales bacterium]|nr:hypothetical protein [Bacteroidales bacterium]